MSNRKYNWALRGFSFLFNKYWSELQEVIIVTDVEPSFELPPNFTVKSMSGGKPLPKEKWSDGLIFMLQKIPDDVFVLLLEDYWLIRKVDNVGVDTLADYMRAHKEILRMDLTDDRQYNGYMKDIGAWGHYDLVETPNESEYQMSLQAGIWSRDKLLSVIRPQLDPAQFELYLSPTLYERGDLRVLGTRQRPVRYANIYYQGRLVPDQIRLVPEEHRKELAKRGWIKGE
jgi:hypothetical protein